MSSFEDAGPGILFRLYKRRDESLVILTIDFPLILCYNIGTKEQRITEHWASMLSSRVSIISTKHLSVRTLLRVRSRWLMLYANRRARLCILIILQLTSSILFAKWVRQSSVPNATVISNGRADFVNYLTRSARALCALCT